jgi:hypothetical protein
MLRKSETKRTTGEREMSDEICFLIESIDVLTKNYYPIKKLIYHRRGKTITVTLSLNFVEEAGAQIFCSGFPPNIGDPSTKEWKEFFMKELIRCLKHKGV